MSSPKGKRLTRKSAVQPRCGGIFRSKERKEPGLLVRGEQQVGGCLASAGCQAAFDLGERTGSVSMRSVPLGSLCYELGYRFPQALDRGERHGDPEIRALNCAERKLEG